VTSLRHGKGDESFFVDVGGDHDKDRSLKIRGEGLGGVVIRLPSLLRCVSRLMSVTERDSLRVRMMNNRTASWRNLLIGSIAEWPGLRAWRFIVRAQSPQNCCRVIITSASHIFEC